MQKYDQLTRHISANKVLKSELQGRRANPLYQYKNGKQTQIGWQESAQSAWKAPISPPSTS